ncbi:unnamed protein product [Clonostachys rhizophaga]|uniref:Uncharacterized protein n=2 Tax=Clonostachys TaxID=110564 RepID=A0A9N9YSM6_9HYPO|nr:unnamed protein product [Clonostachys rhizophaga]
MPQWDIVSQGSGGIVAYKNNSSAVGHVAPRQPVTFQVQNSRASLTYSGPDGSPMTSRALDIAERIASYRSRLALANETILGIVTITLSTCVLKMVCITAGKEARLLKSCGLEALHVLGLGS